MKKLAFGLLLFTGISAGAQTVSYWFQGWQRKPDAAQAQAYFMLPGTNVTFSYANNKVIINAGTNGGGGTNFYYTNTFTTNFYYTNTFTTNAYYTNTFTTNFYYTNDVFYTNMNPLWCDGLTNWCDTTPQDLTNQITYATNDLGTYIVGVSNYFEFTNVINIPCVTFTTTPPTTNQAGCGAIGYDDGNLAVGNNADAHPALSNRGTSVGVNSYGYDLGAALGCAAQAQNAGAAVGYAAFGYTAGAAVGQGARGETYGSALGFNANGSGAGVAVGYATDGHGYGIAIGDYAFGWGVGNVAIGGTDLAANHAEIPVGYTDTVELGRGTGTLSGALHFRGFPLFTKEFVLVATNLYLTVPKWIDIPMNYAYSAIGSPLTLPALTPVTNGSVIEELAFDNGDILWAQGQFQHNVATTNAAFPSFYFEPHVHFTCIGAGLPSPTQSNVTWRIEWQLANINGSWANGTNSATMGITNNHVHYMLELGHITNNSLPHLSSVFRCRLMRPASASQDYGNAHDVLLDAFDLHIPIGNTNAIGSSSDNAP